MQRDSGADLSKIDGDIARLKRELCRTKNALTNQIFKKRQLSSKLSIAVEQKDGELRKLHRTNFDGLGDVLRSLYVFEARLRKEQQQIRRQLGERDAVIRLQQLEIAKLRLSLSRYGNDGQEKNNDNDNAVLVNQDVDVTEIPESSKPDLISSISPRSSEFQDRVDHPLSVSDHRPSPSEQRTRKNDATSPSSPPPLTADATTRVVHNNHTPTNSNLNFNRNVYHSKTVTDLSLNDISSFPNPTPNNNLFVVSNSIFSKNEFSHNEVSKEMVTSIKQNGKVITSALKKADKFPSPKTVHFGKTTHIPEPDEDGQTDIIKTVETLLLQCGDSCTESENDTSSTASTETSPSVSQMVRKFESICTTTNTTGDCKGSSSSTLQDNFNGSYIAEADLKSAAVSEPDSRPDHEKSGFSNGTISISLSDLDPRNNFEEFRFEDSDLDREYRPDGDGLEYSNDQPVPSVMPNVEDCAGQVNYESFLEVTGLSQKSIITVPIQSSNRNLYGSHRNVQKPKDVKSRNRAKSTSFECKLYPPAAIKYWTEPYL